MNQGSVALRRASQTDCRDSHFNVVGIFVACRIFISYPPLPISSIEKIMKYLIDYVRGYLTKNEGNIEPVWHMPDSDFESDFEESLLFDYFLRGAIGTLNRYSPI